MPSGQCDDSVYTGYAGQYYYYVVCFISLVAIALISCTSTMLEYASNRTGLVGLLS